MVYRLGTKFKYIYIYICEGSLRHNPRPPCSQTFVFWWTRSHPKCEIAELIFPVSVVHIVRETISFINTKQVIDQNYPWKKRVKKIKTTHEKLLQKCIFYPSAKDPDPSKVVKMLEKLLFFIFILICLYAWMNLVCLTCLVFLKSFWRPVRTFCALGLLKGTTVY